MSHRHFEGQDHAKWYAQHRPVPPPELIKRLVQFLREKYDGPLELAVDLGCGNGQCTFQLVTEFPSILGTDISAAQIAEAVECCSKLKFEHVKFQVAPAESIPASDNSVQLITICTAAHWMDLPKVYNEARRVLVKNGVLAIMAYHLPLYIPPEEDLHRGDAIQQAVDSVMDVIKDYWPPQASSVLSEYPDVTIPFSDFTRERGFTFKRKARLADILGCIRSYSPYQNFCKDKGHDAGNEILDKVANRITSSLNEGREKTLTSKELEEYEFTETVHYFVLMARV